MITETYSKRDTKEAIKIDIENNVIFLGKNKEYIRLEEKESIINLYKYDKEIFKEYIENIYIKYDFTIISFFIVNKITLEEIKNLNNIILFPLNFCSEYIFNSFILSIYDINIIDFFKYIYSQSYEFITTSFIINFIFYIKRLYFFNKITKYNKFPHNPLLSYNILDKGNKTQRNDNKDIIKDIDDLHIEFYGSKCKYYITYEKKRYDLLNDEDRKDIATYHSMLIAFLKKIYLSEYYKYDSLYKTIMSFEDKEYYTKTIKENIFYLLKDSYKNMNRKEIDKFQKFILREKTNIYNIEKNLLTNDFKRNLYIIDYLNFNSTENDFTNIIINKDFYNIRYRELANIYHKNIFEEYKANKIIYKNNIKIKKISLLELIDLINENDYLNKNILTLVSDFIYLCIDKKSGDILFVHKWAIETDKNIVKFLNKEYNIDFLERVENLEI